MITDPHRPRYHVLPPAGWTNDPNGPIQWKGRYHLFYQHNPGDVAEQPNSAGYAVPTGGEWSWAHVVSDDLAHWEHLPLALSPTPGGPDQNACMSGCAVDNEGVPTLVYTGGGPMESQCIATGSDDLITWTKHPANPVICGPPPGVDAVGFRDTCVWREDGSWRLIVGSGIRGVGASLPLYRSDDLVNWQHLGALFTDRAEQSGPRWDCPDFFPLAGRHVLIVSVCADTWSPFFVGDYADDAFVPQHRGRMDLGTQFYAPQSMRDDRGRRLVWGIIREGRSAAAQAEAGWSRLISLPRQLGLDDGGRLTSEPAPELRALRGMHVGYTDVPLAPDRPFDVENVRSDGLEILARFSPADSGLVGLSVRRSPGGEEETLITYDFGFDRFEINCGRSSLDLSTERPLTGGPLHRAPDQPLELRLFLDASVIEVFANGRAATARLYPIRSDSLGVRVFSQDARPAETVRSRGRAELQSLDLWEIDSIWDGTETIPAGD